MKNIVSVRIVCRFEEIYQGNQSINYVKFSNEMYQNGDITHRLTIGINLLYLLCTYL